MVYYYYNLLWIRKKSYFIRYRKSSMKFNNRKQNGLEQSKNKESSPYCVNLNKSAYFLNMSIKYIWANKTTNNAGNVLL